MAVLLCSIHGWSSKPLFHYGGLCPNINGRCWDTILHEWNCPGFTWQWSMCRVVIFIEMKTEKNDWSLHYIQGHCMGLKLPRETAKFGQPARRQHRQYLKISCWRWRCCAAERWTKLRQLTRQACRVITVVAIFNSWLLKVTLDSAVLKTSVKDWKREARVRVWFKSQQDFLGTDGAASLRVGQICRYEWKFQSHTLDTVPLFKRLEDKCTNVVTVVL